MVLKDTRYLVIEGPIGVGKTSLAQLLARELQVRLILEKVEENPFLKEFYKDPKHYGFQTQIFFLLSRYRQLQELRQIDLFERSTLTDYFFPKDLIFASINLEGSERALYEQLYTLLNPQVPTPDLVIYLQASTEVLMERIRNRALEFERSLMWEYLEAVNQAYNDYFFKYSDSPLLVVQTSEIDFVNRRADLNDLVKQIKQMKKGTQYYVPKK
ncbi:MAG TPA: deoxynucleoside kinase [Nitrospiria bacterium]|nr:deoxynucleoside kinase [Nitrospiria bacterium]